MKKTVIVLFVFLLIPSNSFGQGPHKDCYEKAFIEIAAMLDDQLPLSIKRAVFLVEWAYFDGDIDYEWFCNSIDSTVLFIKKFIAVNKLDKYKTGRNIALYEYFTRPLSGNGYKPFTYDFKQSSEVEDRNKQMVSHVIRTHEGQCFSLPLYYRVLAEAVGAEAYLSFAPKHAFIRYRNEDKLYPEEWVNVELTTHQIQPEFWIVEHFGINATMIEKDVYLHPLSVKETVAGLLGNLVSNYMFQYPESRSDFILKCIDKNLEYYPSDLRVLFIKGYMLNTLIRERLKINHGVVDNNIKIWHEELNHVITRVIELGWTVESEKVLDRLEKEANDAARQRQSPIQ